MTNWNFADLPRNRALLTYMHIQQNFLDLLRDFPYPPRDLANFLRDFADLTREFSYFQRDFANLSRYFADLPRNFANLPRDVADKISWAHCKIWLTYRLSNKRREMHCNCIHLHRLSGNCEISCHTHTHTDKEISWPLFRNVRQHINIHGTLSSFKALSLLFFLIK